MTTKSVQFRKGTEGQHLTFTGLEGEVTVDTSLTKEDLSNLNPNSEHRLSKEDLGIVEVDTMDEVIRAVTPAGVQEAIDNYLKLPVDYIAGLHSIQEGTKLITQPGRCRDALNSSDMVLAETIYKDHKLLWEKGYDKGGLAPNVNIKTCGTLYEFLISDGESVDVGYDSDYNAANLLEYTGYTFYRRKGATLLDLDGNPIPTVSYEISGGGIEVVFKDKVIVDENLNFFTVHKGFTDLREINYTPIINHSYKEPRE